MKKFFSCLFVKFVLYTGRFLGEGTGFLLSFIGLNSITENRGINGKSHQRKIQRHYGAEAVHFLRHGRWICEMVSDGRDFPAKVCPMAFSKCRRPRKPCETAPGGIPKYLPPAAPSPSSASSWLFLPPLPGVLGLLRNLPECYFFCAMVKNL